MLKRSPKPQRPEPNPAPAKPKAQPINVKTQPAPWLPPDAVKRRQEYLKDSYEIERQWWRVIN